MKALSVVMLTLLCIPSFAHDPDPEPAPPPAIASWPDRLLLVGAVYAPAPLVIDRRTELSEKLLDQLGLSAALQWRLFEHLLLGIQGDCLFSEGSRVWQIGPRLGGLLALDEDLALLVHLDGGMASWTLGDRDRISKESRTFFAMQSRVGLGLLWRVTGGASLYFDLAGSRTRLMAAEQIIKLCKPGTVCEGPFDYPDIFRLELTVGASL